MTTKTYYLEGVIHTDQLGDSKIVTTWTGTEAKAVKEMENLEALGASRAFVMRDGKAGYKIVGHFHD